MNASGDFDTSIAGAVGYEKFAFNEQSIAVMNRQNTICVLALAKQGRGVLRFLNDMEFKSPTCAVQSNSSDDQGMITSSSFTPVAKSFCSAGGASGSFFPAIRGECREIPDPYVKFTPPPPGDCMKPETFDMKVDRKGKVYVANPTANMLLNGHEDPGTITVSVPGKHEHPHCHLKNPITGAQQCHISNHKVGDIHAASDGSRLDNLGLSPNEISRLIVDYGLSNLEVPESTNYTRAGRTYQPGTYCGGLTVDGADVKFEAGTYIMKDGPLTFKNGATATAKDVSFVLYGPSSVVTVESGSYVDVKAPKSGPLAGLAFYQDESVVNPNIKLPPVGVNLLSSGGELNVTGTMYFPDQALDVLGDSVLGAKAPATSFIAYQVTFAGSTKAEVKVDHIAGEIPVMLPMSDDGARLIQ
ncbi:MAG: hypothetical protein EX271_12515 [Acidimicrobiales bacterium]|nr:MAG: hypothetical protein EX271_12515 [Acidimicrobiales bacterium]